MDIEDTICVDIYIFVDIYMCLNIIRTSLVVEAVKRLPTMWETQVQSLGWEDPLEKEMATHCSTLAWEVPWTEEPGGLESMGLQMSRTCLSD